MAKRPVIACDSELESLMPQGLSVPRLAPTTRTAGTDMSDNESSTVTSGQATEQPPPSMPTSSPPAHPAPSGTEETSHTEDKSSAEPEPALHRSRSESSGMQAGSVHDGHHGTDMGLVSHRLQSGGGAGGGTTPPVITYDEVVTTPSTPTGTRGPDVELTEHGLYNLPAPVENKGTGMTPASSLLAVNKPIQLRESTLTVNYPENELEQKNDLFYIDLDAGEIKKRDQDQNGEKITHGNQHHHDNGHQSNHLGHHGHRGSHMRRRKSTVQQPEDEDEALLYSRNERIPMKDFGAEIRASMDVERYLNQAVLLLDVAETAMEDILSKMLQLIIDKKEEPSISVEECIKAIFTHDTVPKLAKTIQGTCNLYGRGIDYDQSWICILCTMVSMQKRHVAIARLRHPANLGKNCQEVYFIILVAAPTREKGTKNALETGRTFATLFANMDLRQRLLAVHNQEDFKRVMWTHTKELAEKQNNQDGKLSNGDASSYDEESNV